MEDRGDYHRLSIHHYTIPPLHTCFVYKREQYIAENDIHPHANISRCCIESPLNKLWEALIYASFHESKHRDFGSFHESKHQYFGNRDEAIL